ncbi:MAG: divalent metal cation transporter [Bacteroidaceae bacterium]|nr:divalent metal cation transporter [Bacteroidaceae bacterium]
MVTFAIALVVLILGYVFYGKFIEKFFGADGSRPVPSATMADGVDFIAMPAWKAYMIQFLNIAGLGPIFGAIMGAKYGTASYLWIVLGTIFAGSVHDYLSGMISLRNGGESLPQLVGRYLGDNIRKVFTLFTMLLLVLVTAVFVSQPADLLDSLTGGKIGAIWWIVIIFVYYFVATLFPIDKVIGKLYPIFGAALLFMALGIMVSLFVRHPQLPEMWNGLGTKYESNPIFPMMFVSIACGAISGFHATQSPLMARCLTNEKKGRPVFYGAMISEGIVALVWAAAATAYFGEKGADASAAQIVMEISKTWLGKLGGVLAVLGVVAAPVSTGDTALRSARLIVADFFHMRQKTVRSRLVVSIPIVIVTLIFLFYSLRDKDGFNVIWRYFAWSNQTLSVFTLWALTVYFEQKGKNLLVTMIPALFMTFVTSVYILMAKEGLKLPPVLAYSLGAAFTAFIWMVFMQWRFHFRKGDLDTREK